MSYYPCLVTKVKNGFSLFVFKYGLAERAGYKIVITRFLERKNMRFINTSNLGLRPRFLGLMILIFPSELGYNCYIIHFLT